MAVSEAGKISGELVPLGERAILQWMSAGDGQSGNFSKKKKGKRGNIL